MSILHLQRSKELKLKNLSREEIAIRALKICQQAINCGSYKNAVGAIGRMKALGQCIHDDYWEEKRDIGFNREFLSITHGQLGNEITEVI